MGKEKGNSDEQLAEPRRPNVFVRGYRKVRSRTRLSIPQLIATALAAITMAVVSSQLSSFSSSILIAGLIAVVSAVSSEFYRILIATGAEKTKEVVAPVFSEGARRPDSGETPDTTETVMSNATVAADDTVVSAGTVVSTAASSPTEQTPVALTGEHGSSASADEDETAGEPSGESSAGFSGESDGESTSGTAKKGRPRKKVGSALVSALRHNQVVQMSLVFFLVALVTVGVSYAVARAQGGGSYTTFTTVQQSLSDEEKQALLDEAAAQTGSGETAEEIPGDVPAPTEDADDGSPEEPEGGDEPDSQLAEEVARLQRENEELRNSIDDLAASLDGEQDTITELLARLDALEAQLAQQEAIPDSPTD